MKTGSPFLTTTNGAQDLAQNASAKRARCSATEHATPTSKRRRGTARNRRPSIIQPIMPRSAADGDG